jgi:hypothetical protein
MNKMPATRMGTAAILLSNVREGARRRPQDCFRRRPDKRA